jgi:hypothetical protein
MKNVMAFFLLLAFSVNGYAVNILKPIVKSAANDCEVGFSLTKPMHGYLLSLESASKDGFGLRYKLSFSHDDDFPKGTALLFKLKGLYLAYGRYAMTLSKFGVSGYMEFNFYRQGSMGVVDVFDFQPGSSGYGDFSKKIATCKFAL